LYAEGEIATGRAAKNLDQQMILSTASTTAIEDVVAARNAPVWFQLYAMSPWEITEKMIRRAEAAGSTTLVLTVDVFSRGKKETLERYRRKDDRDCSVCHKPGPLARFMSKPMVREALTDQTIKLRLSSLSWDLVKRIRENTQMRLVIKGIETAEDAALALANGVDGIIVSNHGGRSLDSARATIDSLREVVAEVDGRIPVLVDGGFRRGSDIFKAIALGASAVCIGRPYLWGLGAFGQAGVEQVLRLLNAELEIVMKQAGVRSLRDINSSYVVNV
jgi:(S)-2-hydroxy-acid oxidase